MLTQDLNNYLAVRRAAGFKLTSTERYLRYFVHFARTRGDTLVRGQLRSTGPPKPVPKSSATGATSACCGSHASSM